MFVFYTICHKLFTRTKTEFEKGGILAHRGIIAPTAIVEVEACLNDSPQGFEGKEEVLA